MRRLGIALATVVAAALPMVALGAPAAGATRSGTGVFSGHTMNGHPLPCDRRAGGLRACHGGEGGSEASDYRFKSFDGTPLDVFVTLPPASQRPKHGYPLVVQSHGWGDPPTGPTDHQYGGPSAVEWAKDGYAVLQFAARGWGHSCGKTSSRLVNVAACLNGYLHLDDYRYEARDVQYAVGLLVDEGLADPDRVGATGESYGGGLSLELATLKNRVMYVDGSLHRWLSPAGTPIHIAAAAPFATWSDLIYALAPNGRTLDSRITSAKADLSPAGVEKLTILSGLYLVGTEGAYFALPGRDPQANVTAWYASIDAGEPYTTPLDRELIRQGARFHSPYYLLRGAYGMRREPPAPMLLANGFTDDVFPADEVLRYYNLERSLYPHDPIKLLLADIGHQRADNKPADDALLPPRIKTFFDHYVKGTGPRPALGVTAVTQRCPANLRSEGPYHAKTWKALQPGTVTYRSKARQTVLSTGGNPLVSKAFDPVAGGLACTTAPSTNQGLGIATYRLPAAKGSGYTLLGSPTITANLELTGKYAYLAGRLLDVNPVTKTEVLVARGVYRLDPDDPNGRQTFQLHPGAWRFANGHIPVLQLLGMDEPYTRPSNFPFSIAVSNLRLRLPTHERTIE
jgi:dienelactone hydrolase